jgi:hypothetical protein
VDAVPATGDRHRRVGDPDVGRRRHGVIAGMRRVVAGRARADDDRQSEIVVDAGHARDSDGESVEELLPLAIAGRAALRPFRGAPIQASYSVKTMESSQALPGSQFVPAGSPPRGSLTPKTNGGVESASGPPGASAAVRAPAAPSKTCAVKRPIS